MRCGLLFAALTVFALSASGVQAAEPEFLKYEDFLQKVQDGKVKSVSLGPFYYVEGKYAQGDREIEFFSHSPIDAASDPLLTKLLEEKQVTMVKAEPQEPSISSTEIMIARLLPLILVVFVVLVLIYVVKINNKINQVIIR